MYFGYDRHWFELGGIGKIDDLAAIPTLREFSPARLFDRLFTPPYHEQFCMSIGSTSFVSIIVIMVRRCASVTEFA